MYKNTNAWDEILYIIGDTGENIVKSWSVGIRRGVVGVYPALSTTGASWSRCERNCAVCRAAVPAREALPHAIGPEGSAFRVVSGMPFLTRSTMSYHKS